MEIFIERPFCKCTNYVCVTMRERPETYSKSHLMAETKEKGNIPEKKVSAVCNTVQLPIILLPRDHIFKVSNTDKLSIQIRTSK